MKDFQYYKFIRNMVQLRDIQLVEMKCKVNEQFSKGELPVNLVLHNKVIVISKREAFIYLKTEISFETEGPFSITMVHRGLCYADKEELEEKEFEEYAGNQVVPLLLSYARECAASTLARMGLPIYHIPTMDVLESVTANAQTSDQE